MRKLFFPKLRVHIKDNNNSPHGKFHRFLFWFSSKFPDLNFAPYVLYIYSCYETSTWHKQWAWVTCVFRGPPGVYCFQRWTLGKKIAQSFLSTAKIITSYSSERFSFVFTLRKYRLKAGFLKFCKLISNLVLGQIIVSNLNTKEHKLAS